MSRQPTALSRLSCLPLELFTIDNLNSQHEDINFTLKRERCVCASCVEDSSLQDVLMFDTLEAPCYFCGSTSEIRGKLSSILKAIRSRLIEDWSEFSEAWDAHLLGELDEEALEDAEQGEWLSFSDILEYAEYRPTNTKYLRAIQRAFGDIRLFWRGEGDSLQRDNERHASGWEQFKEIVKHQRRFTFWSHGKPGKVETLADLLEIGAGDMLDEIATLVIEAGLLKVIPKGTRYWRARVHQSNVRLRNTSDVFPPPISKATQANRMSPSGIVMFYGAEAISTALLETADVKRHKDHRVTFGEFTTLRELVLLDLCDTSGLPSYFEDSQREEWHRHAFLLRFGFELARPIRRDQRDHIEYAPTQAFTEFVRFQMRDESNHPIDGIRYKSSRDAKPCVVLFCNGEHCADSRYCNRIHWLSVAADTVKSMSVRRALKQHAGRGLQSRAPDLGFAR